MEPKVNYLVVGLFVVGLAAILIVALIWFTAAQHKPHKTYQVYMTEPATGLIVQAPVKFNGVDVGTVKDIKLNYANPKQVCLILSIEEGTPINQGTTATLMVQGITGVTYVGLSAKTLNAPPLQILPGERYPIIPYTPSLLVQLNNVLRDVADTMKSIRVVFKNLLTEQNQHNIENSLANIAKFTDTMANNTQRIDEIFKATADTLLQTQAMIKAASHQTVPNINQSINRLDNMLNTMDQFTKELKSNPSMLIRGKAASPPGPGEK